VRTERKSGFNDIIMFATIPRKKIEVYFAENSKGIIGCDKGGSRFQYFSFSIFCVLSNKYLSSFKKRIWRRQEGDP